ncbi:unnamed protein product [Dibothriocephalus latus]|uniref:Uncharacterized protein n=1 Tax=Dibothriocephalus latus TaxID=60516 RepID=A0A3P6UWI6_DIBLA|nr:unnamed protein product [Dibothriocephalus latus]
MSICKFHESGNLYASIRIGEVFLACSAVVFFPKDVLVAVFQDSSAGYRQPYASTLPIPTPTSALPNQPTVQQRQHHHQQHQPSNKQNDQELTVEDLRSIVNRQLTNIEAQKKDILKKTQRINELRSKLKPILAMPASRTTHSATDSLPPMYKVPETVLPWSGFEMTREDEVNLNKLRQLRGHTEQLRLENEALGNSLLVLYNCVLFLVGRDKVDM